MEKQDSVECTCIIIPGSVITITTMYRGSNVRLSRRRNAGNVADLSGYLYRDYRLRRPHEVISFSVAFNCMWRRRRIAASWNVSHGRTTDSAENAGWVRWARWLEKRSRILRKILVIIFWRSLQMGNFIVSLINSFIFERNCHRRKERIKTFIKFIYPNGKCLSGDILAHFFGRILQEIEVPQRTNYGRFLATEMLSEVGRLSHNGISTVCKCMNAVQYSRDAVRITGIKIRPLIEQNVRTINEINEISRSTCESFFEPLKQCRGKIFSTLNSPD